MVDAAKYEKALKATLPNLKPGIGLYDGPRSHFGAPTIIVHDPAADEHFRFDWRAGLILKNWEAGKPVLLFLEDLNKRTSANVTFDMLSEFVLTLKKHHLTAYFETEYDPDIHAPKPFSWKDVLLKYFYWRIPLVNPDKALKKMVPYVRPLLNRGMAFFIFLAGLLALYLLSTQWGSYIATLPYMFTTEGILVAIISIIFIKCWHEFGHGIITKSFGRPVTTMGVAFLFLFPILYTDTSQAWTIRDRKKRMAIDGAGVGIEVILAIIATYAWLVTPDGPWRSAFFMMSSTTWIVSLFVNLNPLLKFDGYYLLSDYWNLPNMQSRSIALMQWRIRRIFLNWPGEKPEQFPPKLERKLIIYSIASMLYRIVIFMSISLFVYAFFFKLLGLFLVLLNLVWLIILPLAKELYVWWAVRKEPHVQKRKRAWLMGGVIVALVLFVPTRSVIQAPALMLPEKMTMLYASEAAQVESFDVTVNDNVDEGAYIMHLSTSELEKSLAIEQSRNLEADKMLRASSVSTLLVQARKRLEEEVRLTRERIGATTAKIKDLRLKAPFTGKVVWLNDTIKVGDWVEVDAPLATIADPTSLEIKSYIEERDWEKYGACSTTLFYPADPRLPSLEVELIAESAVGGNEVSDPFFASTYGGEIAVREDTSGRMIADTAIQELTFSPLGENLTIARPTKGTIRLCSSPKSIASGIVDGIYVLFVRELGF